MKGRNHTNYALSNKIGYSESALSKVFSGKMTLGVYPLIKISELYGVTIDWLLKGKETDTEARLRREIEELNNEIEQLHGMIDKLKKSMTTLLEGNTLERSKQKHIVK